MKSERRRSPRLSLSVNKASFGSAVCILETASTVPGLHVDPSGQAKSTEMFEQVGPIPMQSLSPNKKLTFSCPADNLDEPFSAGVGKVVLLNISQIGLLYRGRLMDVDVSDISDFFSNCYKSPKVKYKNMDFKNSEIFKCTSF